MATHSGILAWTIPWKEEPGGLKSDTTEATEHARIALCWSLMCSEVTQLIHIYSFLIFFSIMEKTIRDQIQFPVLYGRTLLFICLLHKSLPLLIPDSQSLPPTTAPWQPHVCSLCL